MSFSFAPSLSLALAVAEIVSVPFFYATSCIAIVQHHSV